MAYSLLTPVLDWKAFCIDCPISTLFSVLYVSRCELWVGLTLHTSSTWCIALYQGQSSSPATETGWGCPITEYLRIWE